MVSNNEEQPEVAKQTDLPRTSPKQTTKATKRKREDPTPPVLPHFGVTPSRTPIAKRLRSTYDWDKTPEEIPKVTPNMLPEVMAPMEIIPSTEPGEEPSSNKRRRISPPVVNDDTPSSAPQIERPTSPKVGESAMVSSTNSSEKTRKASTPKALTEQTIDPAVILPLDLSQKLKKSVDRLSQVLSAPSHQVFTSVEPQDSDKLHTKTDSIPPAISNTAQPKSAEKNQPTAGPVQKSPVHATLSRHASLPLLPSTTDQDESKEAKTSVPSQPQVQQGRLSISDLHKYRLYQESERVKKRMEAEERRRQQREERERRRVKTDQNGALNTSFGESSELSDSQKLQAGRTSVCKIVFCLN